VAAGFQKWPQVFNLRIMAPDLLHVQVENLHPLCRKWPQVFNLREPGAGCGSCAG